MLKIYLTRHGQDKDNVNKILTGQGSSELTKDGKSQVRDLCNQIKNKKITIDHIYTSPQPQSVQTARIISDKLSLPKPILMDNLTERDFGEMTGQALNRIREKCEPYVFDSGNIDYFLYPKDGETFPQAIIRAKKTLRKIKSKHKIGTLLLVTHGDFGKAFYSAFYKLDWDEVLQLFHFGNCDLIELSLDHDPYKPHTIKVKQLQNT